MMKKIMLSIMVILIISTSVFAFDYRVEKVDPKAPEKISNMAVEILGALQWFGYAIAIGMIIYIGIRYVLSAANEKASLKQSSINYVIGAIIVASCTTIFPAIVGMFEKAPPVNQWDNCAKGEHVKGPPMEIVNVENIQTIWKCQVCDTVIETKFESTLKKDTDLTCEEMGGHKYIMVTERFNRLF